MARIAVFEHTQNPETDPPSLHYSKSTALKLYQRGLVIWIGKRAVQRVPPETAKPELQIVALAFDYYDYPQQLKHPELQSIPALIYPRNLAQHYGKSSRRWRR